MENKTAMLSSEIERRKVKEATKEKQFAEMAEKLQLLTSQLEELKEADAENEVLKEWQAK